MIAPSQHTNASAGKEAVSRELAKGWAESTLGEAFHWQSGGTPKRTVAEYYGGQIPWAIIGDLTDSIVESTEETLTEEGLNASTARWVRQGAILLAMYGSIGKLGIAGVDLTTNQAIAFTQTDVMSNKYLFFFLLANRNELIALGKGDTQSNISQTVIKQFPFVLAPLAEQHRIVAEIEKQFTRLDASVAALKRVQANLKRYRASVLKAACEGKLVPTEAELDRVEGRDYEPADRLLDRILVERRKRWEIQENRSGKYKEPVAPDTSNLPELPEGWMWATLPQLGELNRGKSKHRPRNDPRLLGGPYPFIQTGDIRHSQGMVTCHSQTYTEYGLAQSRLWPAGTLCITIAANIAETGILSYPACFPDSVVGFVCDNDPVITQFIEFFIRTEREGLERFAPATAQKNINLKVLSDLVVPLPPIAEQRRIVAEVERRISVIQQAEATVETNLIQEPSGCARASSSRRSRASLVPQDPNDEPASELLKRIRAEREAGQATASKPRGRSKHRTARSSSEKQLGSRCSGRKLR